MLSVAITSGRMETFARTLDRVAASGVVPKLRVDALRSSFLATDAQGRSWTLDLESHRWGRLHGDRWMVEDPPQQLLIDPELRASLEQLEAMAARAIVKGDSIHMPRSAWFRASGSAPEPSEPSTPTTSVVESAPPQLPVDREPSPLPAASVVVPVISAPLEPAARASEEIPSAPAPALVPATAPVVSVTPRKPRVRRSRRLVEPVGEHAPLVPARIFAQANPIQQTPRRPTIPKEHLRFAGPGFMSVSDELETPVLAVASVSDAMSAPQRTSRFTKSPAPATLRRTSPARKHWVPASIAPHLMSEHHEAHEGRAPVFLSGLAAALFFALAFWMGDGRGYAAGLLCGVLSVTLVVLNHTRSRED